MGKKILNKKIIGVIGGMGPQASCEFYRILIEKSINDFGVKNNDEFPEILIDSVPVPDFISDTKNLKIATEMLQDRVNRMNKYPVDIICIACNTAHILYPKLQVNSSVKIISIVEEIERLIRINNLKRIGLLATITTYRLGLYDKIGRDGITLFKPDGFTQFQLEKIIRGVIGGEERVILRKQITRLTNKFIKKNSVDCLILGCTELPLIFPKIKNVKVFNSLEILANRMLTYYFDKEEIC